MLGIAISLFMTSCVKYSIKDEIITPQTTEVALSVETGSLESNSVPESNSFNGVIASASGEYNRSNAPVYVSGVKIIARSIDYPSFDEVSSDFKFVEGNSGGKDIKMTVPFGENKFSAVSMSGVTPKNETYANCVNKYNGSEDKLKYYTEELIKIQDIYAVFEGSENYIVDENNPSFNIPMSTESARYGIVLETSENYNIKMTATLGSVQKEITKATSQKASAIVYNGVNVADGQELVVKLEVLVNNVVVKTKILNSYTAEAGKNKTLIISYNKNGEIHTEETGISFTWTPMENKGEIIDID